MRIEEVRALFEGKRNIKKTNFRGGLARVYVKHDGLFGTCLLPDGTLTPNMPKLEYFFNISPDQTREIVRISPSLREVTYSYVFYKLDGFNLIAYPYKGEVIYKTRTLPEAAGNVKRVLEDPWFPHDAIKELVKDDYIPVLEVWGPKLEKYDILFGGTDVEAFADAFGYDDLNVTLVAMRFPHPEEFYPYYNPALMIKTAGEYGIDPAPLLWKGKLEFVDALRIMRDMEEENLDRDKPIFEGAVVHSLGNFKAIIKVEDYRIYKIKPFSILLKDVIFTRIPPVSRIKLELSKVLLEKNLVEASSMLDETIEEVIEYLAEDYKVTKDLKDAVFRVVRDHLARALGEELIYPHPKILAVLGVDKRVIGYYASNVFKKRKVGDHPQRV